MRYRVAAATAYFAVLTWIAHSSDANIPEWIALTVIFALPFAVGFIAAPGP